MSTSNHGSYVFYALILIMVAVAGAEILERQGILPAVETREQRHEFVPPQPGFWKNMTVRVFFEGCNYISDVTLRHIYWVDGDWKPGEMVPCLKDDVGFISPKGVEFVFHNSLGEFWMSFDHRLALQFDTGNGTISFDELDVDFRIPEETFWRIKNDEINGFSLRVHGNESNVNYVWEGSLDETDSKTEFFAAASGLPVRENLHEIGLGGEGLFVEVSDAAPYSPNRILLLNNEASPVISEVTYGELSGYTVESILEADRVFVTGQAFDYYSCENDHLQRVIRVETLWLDELPNPYKQGEVILREAVGDEYFDSWFTLGNVEYNHREPEEWWTRVSYKYWIRVAGYDVTRQICFWFDEQGYLKRSEGVPSDDNLMPFTITKEEAIDIALNETMLFSDHEIEAEIRFIDHLFDRTPVERYLWAVHIYLNKKTAWSGSLQEIYICPNTGEIVDNQRISWSSTP